LKKGKKAKTLIEKYRQECKKNNLETNLKFLNKISKPIIKYDLIESAISKKSINKKDNKDKNKQESEEKSVFTEEDFRNFEKAYFNR
jgi:hypothetical protein